MHFFRWMFLWFLTVTKRPKVFIDLDGTLVHRVTENNLDQLDPSLERYEMHYEKGPAQHYVLRSDANAFIRTLRKAGCIVCIITTGASAHQRSVCEALGLNGYHIMICDINEKSQSIKLRGPWVLLDEQCPTTAGVFDKLAFMGVKEAHNLSWRYEFYERSEIVNTFFTPYFIRIKEFWGKIQVPLVDYIPEIQEKFQSQIPAK